MHRLRAALAAALVACTVEGARATVLVPATLDELSHDAFTIARGRVVALDARWTDETRRAIETMVTLEVDAYLKRTLGPTVQFRVPGGQLGRYRSVFVGAPEFEVDQQVVVFLGARGPAVPFVLGMGQGVYRVARVDESTWVVTPPPIIAGRGTTAIVRGDASRVPMPLADFERRVRALARSAR